MWIADTGASTHSTPHSVGMTGCKDGGIRDTIVVGDGTNVKAGKIGILQVSS